MTQLLISVKFVIIHITSFAGTIIHFELGKEETELEMCKRHKRYFEEIKSIGIDVWKVQNSLLAQAEDVQRDINLFISRYSDQFEIKRICGGCSENIEEERFRCLNCTDIDLCYNCYDGGIRPNEHLDSHEVIEFRLG